MPISADIRESLGRLFTASTAAFLAELRKRHFSEPDDPEAVEIFEAAVDRAVAQVLNRLPEPERPMSDIAEEVPFGVARFHKGAYMAEFMQVKRGREAFAATVENLRRLGCGDGTLEGYERVLFMKETARRWKAQLDAELDARRAHEADGGRMPAERLRHIRTAFWDRIHLELIEQTREILAPELPANEDSLLCAADDRLMKSAQRVRVVPLVAFGLERPTDLNARTLEQAVSVFRQTLVDRGWRYSQCWGAAVFSLDHWPQVLGYLDRRGRLYSKQPPAWPTLVD